MAFSAIQAVGNRGELWFRVVAGRFTQDVFIDFLRRLVKTAEGRKLILVVDGHPGHRGKKARAFIDARPDLLEVVYLPGYSPDLNLAEYLNNDTKHGVLSRRPATPDELAGRARSHLHRRQKQPHVVRGFFPPPRRRLRRMTVALFTRRRSTAELSEGSPRQSLSVSPSAVLAHSALH